MYTLDLSRFLHGVTPSHCRTRARGVRRVFGLDCGCCRCVCGRDHWIYGKAIDGRRGVAVAADVEVDAGETTAVRVVGLLKLRSIT